MRTPFQSRLLIAILLAGLCPDVCRSAEPTALDLFDERILPIFRSEKPSSSVQCHLASVDLKNYILPSAEKTFASLRDQGLIDLKSPQKSKILTLIGMGEKDLDKGARLIHAQTRRAEYEAFAAWITACANDPALRNAPAVSVNDLGRPEKSNAVIRHARKSRVVDSFARNIWSQRMRCFPCHTPHEIDASNPRHRAALKTRDDFQRKYSPEFMERLGFFRKTPEETLRYLIARSRETPRGERRLIDLREPGNSLILLKPLSKLPKKRADGTFDEPSSADPVTHMGGLKMHKDDQSYKSFVAWLNDYANVVGDRYASVEDLPADNWSATQYVLKLSEAPSSWKVGTPVQLFLHTWNDKQAAWNPAPAAFTQGTVTPRRMVNGALFLLTGAAPDAPREDAAVLAGGRYLVKVHVDTQRRLADDPTLLLGAEEFYGQTEFRKSRWREGFRYGVTVFARTLKPVRAETSAGEQP